MFNSDSSVTVTNCTFAANKAAWYGGGIHSTYSSSPTLANCILWGDSPQVIFVNLSLVAYSDVKGGYAGTDNIATDPLFVDPDGPDNIFGTVDDDLHLRLGSPCIDTGTATGAPDADIEGKPRPLGKDYDMGAYEFQETTMPWIPFLLLDD